MTVNRTRDQRSAALRAGIMSHIPGAERAETRRQAKQAARKGIAAAPAIAATAAKTAEIAKAVFAPPPATAIQKPMKISDAALAQARVEAAKRKGGNAPMTLEQRMEVFRPYQPAPGVLPKDVKPIAMDEAIGPLGGFEAMNSWGAESLGASFAEGIGFLGYSYLAALTQRPEYRRISERIATEMTRKWIKFQTVNTPDELDEMGPDAEATVAQDLAPSEVKPAPQPMSDQDIADQEAAGAAEQAESDVERVQASIKRKKGLERAKKLKELEDEMTRLKVKDAFYNVAEGDGWFGRYHLFLDVVGGSFADYDRDELRTDIGDGSNIVSRTKVGNETKFKKVGKGAERKEVVKRGKLQAIRCVEPMWCYPSTYNSTNPLDPDFYNPTMWFVNGIEVHRSRLLTFVGREVPDILKPAYAFGGLSMSQMAKPYVDNWLRTRQAVCDLIESFSVSGVYTNMSGILQDGGLEALKRIDLFNTMRSNAGAFTLDKETEEFFNVSTPLGTLDHLQAQSQEQMSSVSGIPLIILLGITPTGLNASSEGEIRAFYDTIHAFQEQFFRDALQTVINFIMLSLWGKIDKDITFEFEPLWSMTDKEAAEIRKIDAETDQIMINAGVVDPGEARTRVANDPSSLYPDIDPEDVPEAPMQDMMGEGDDPFGGGGGDDGGAGGNSNPGGFNGASDEALLEAALLGSDEWNEADHPRADNGQFGSGGSKPSGGTGSSSPKASKSKSESSAPSSSNSKLNVSKLTKQGGKLGSNEGGVYSDDSGAKFYIKKPKTADHVANEMAAARLYQLAGVNTLSYRDAGPDHVATAWEKLGKNNISQFTPEEKKAAAKDFAIHAWLSNWDAAGTGGDNQGMRDGKPVTLDVGGSLRYRAQGGPKGAAFGNKVSEIDTMRNASMSPDAARLYGKMSDAELKASVERVTSIPDEAIRKAAGDKDLADTLIARKQDLAKRFGTIAVDEDMMLAALDAALNLEEIAEDVFVVDAVALDEFQESKHPRDKDGKFTDGGGASSSSAAGEVAKAFKSKKEQIGHMLTQGVTPKELMTAMGWPSVSMPAQAKSLGMKLEKKDGKYYGTKMSAEELEEAKKADAEKAKQKAAAKSGATPETLPGSPAGKKAEPKPESTETKAEAPKAKTLEEMSAPANYSQFLGQLAGAIEQKDGPGLKKLMGSHPEWAQQFESNASPAGKAALKAAMGGADLDKPAPTPAKPKAPQASPEELKKASKGTTLPISYTSPGAVQLIKDFNEKYAGKTLTDPEALNQKVQDYKDLTKAAKEMDAEYAAANKAEQEAAQKKAAKEKADALAAKMNDPAVKEHYEILSGIGAGKYQSSHLQQHYANVIKTNNLPITEKDAAYIGAYVGTHYGPVNEQLRKGVVTVEQYKYAQALDQALDKMPKYEGTVYRGVNLEPHHVQKYLNAVGQIVPEPGFQSAGVKGKLWGSHTFHIKSKTARDIRSFNPGEGGGEVVFKNNTAFLVEKVEGTKIYMREV